MAISKQDIRMIITDPEGTRKLVETADSLGQDLKGMGLTTNQIRAIFGEVRQIQAQWGMEDGRSQAYKRLILLKPKMAYRARRERGKAVGELVNVLDAAVDEVIAETESGKQNEHFVRFVEFFEAILAYHKAYGGN